MSHPAHAGVVLTPPKVASELARSLRSGPDLALLDPACGEGALLLAALEARGGDPEYARQRLFGFEIDAGRAERARERLRAAAGLPPGTELDDHIRVADALDPALEWPAGTSVLANPPWLSFSGRQTASLVAAGAKNFVATANGGWPSLHGAFLERIARHCASEQTGAALLLPAPVAFLPSYSPLRAAVETLVRLRCAPAELGEDVFPGVTEPTILLVLEPTRSEDPSGRPWLNEDSGDREWLAKLSKFPRLPTGSFADPGVHTGNSAAHLIFEEPGANRVGVRRGRDLFPYELREPETFLRTDLEPTPERRFRAGPLERYAAFPVLLRQTAKRPMAALHKPARHFRNSLLGMRRVDGLDPAFCVAVLNSSVAAEYHRAAQRDSRQKNFPQVKVGHLAQLPFPIATRDEAPAAHDKIAGLVLALEAGDRDFASQTARIDELVTEMFGLSCFRTDQSSKTS